LNRGYLKVCALLADSSKAFENSKTHFPPIKAVVANVINYLWNNHRHLRKVDGSSFVMFLPLAQPLPRAFLQWPHTLQAIQTRRWYMPLISLFFKMMSMGTMHLWEIIT
jgi:hypothetical protein